MEGNRDTYELTHSQTERTPPARENGTRFLAARSGKAPGRFFEASVALGKRIGSASPVLSPAAVPPASKNSRGAWLRCWEDIPDLPGSLTSILALFPQSAVPPGTASARWT